MSYKINVRGQPWKRHAEQLRPGSEAEGTDSSPPEQQGEKSEDMDSRYNIISEDLIH